MMCRKCGGHCSPLGRNEYNYFTCDECGLLHIKKESQTRLKLK